MTNIKLDWKDVVAIVAIMVIPALISNLVVPFSAPIVSVVVLIIYVSLRKKPDTPPKS